MATKLSPEDKLVTAALAAIEKGGWKALSLTALGRKAKIPPATLYDLCPDKRALLQLIGKRIDVAALERAVEPDESIPPRDRAFDAIIGCFESMTPLKPAIAVIHADSKGDPAVANYFVIQVVSADPAKWGENKAVETLAIPAPPPPAQ